MSNYSHFVPFSGCLQQRGGRCGEALRRGAVVLGFATLGLLAAGCGGKVAECNKLVSVINSNAEAVKTATTKMDTSKGDPKPFEELAGAMDKAADSIKGVPLKNEELKKLAKEYEEMMRNGAKDARSMVTAAAANDVAGLNKAMGEMGKIETAEAQLINKLNTFCLAK